MGIEGQGESIVIPNTRCSSAEVIAHFWWYANQTSCNNISWI